MHIKIILQAPHKHFHTKNHFKSNNPLKSHPTNTTKTLKNKHHHERVPQE